MDQPRPTPPLLDPSLYHPMPAIEKYKTLPDDFIMTEQQRVIELWCDRAQRFEANTRARHSSLLDLQLRYDFLTLESHATNEHAENLAMQRDKLLATIDALKSEVNALTAQQKTAKSHVEMLSRENDSQKAELETMAVEGRIIKSQLDSEIRSQKAQIDSSKLRAETMAIDNQSLSDNYDLLFQESYAKDVDIARLTSENQSQRTKFEALESENLLLTTQVSSMKSDIKTHLAWIDSLNSDNDSKNIEIGQLISDRQTQQTKFEALEAENRLLATQVSSKKSDIQAYLGRVDGFNSENHATDVEIGQLTSELSPLQDETQLLKTELKSLQEQFFENGTKSESQGQGLYSPPAPKSAIMTLPDDSEVLIVRGISLDISPHESDTETMAEFESRLKTHFEDQLNSQVQEIKSECAAELDDMRALYRRIYSRGASPILSDTSISTDLADLNIGDEVGEFVWDDSTLEELRRVPDDSELEQLQKLGSDLSRLKQEDTDRWVRLVKMTLDLKMIAPGVEANKVWRRLVSSKVQ